MKHILISDDGYLSEGCVWPHEHPPALDRLDDGEAVAGLRVSHLPLLHLVTCNPSNQGGLLITGLKGFDKSECFLNKIYPQPLIVRGTAFKPLLRAW